LKLWVCRFFIVVASSKGTGHGESPNPIHGAGVYLLRLRNDISTFKTDKMGRGGPVFGFLETGLTGEMSFATDDRVCVDIFTSNAGIFGPQRHPL
jgi:hypothetical protein